MYKAGEYNLKTSYVIVQRFFHTRLLRGTLHLKTSYVIVQRLILL